MYIEPWGDQNAYATVHFPRADLSPERTVVVSVASSAVLRVVDTSPSPTAAVDMVLFDLHYALFGGRLVRLLYVLLALAVCAVSVTDNVIWLERRDARRKRCGNRLLERLTVGVCRGLVFASALYCALDRVLPVDLPLPADSEFQLFLRELAARECARVRAQAGGLALRELVLTRGWRAVRAGARKRPGLAC